MRTETSASTIINIHQCHQKLIFGSISSRKKERRLHCLNWVDPAFGCRESVVEFEVCEPWREMRHLTQSSCRMDIRMEDLIWHPWHQGWLRATGHPKDLGWWPFFSVSYRRSRATQNGSLNLHEFRPQAWLEVGNWLGPFAACLLKTGHWSRTVWKSGIIRISRMTSSQRAIRHAHFNTLACNCLRHIIQPFWSFLHNFTLKFATAPIYYPNISPNWICIPRPIFQQNSFFMF